MGIIPKAIRLASLWLVLGMAVVGCREGTGAQATAPVTSVAAPTSPVVEATATEPPEPPTVTSTAVASGETPTATVPLAATETETATATVTTEATVTVTVTATAITGTERFTPGQRATTSLENGEFAVFPFSGAALETLLFFVEPDDDLNVDMAVYEGEVATGDDLRTLTPLVQANAGAAGVPEVLVFVPDDDGDFSLVVAAMGEGQATVHFVDVQTGGAANTLAAGEVVTSQFYSNISRPVLIFVDPIEDGDIVVRATTTEGEVLAESNFGGPGAAEVLFMLPPQTSGFHFEISEATGMPAQYHLLAYVPESTPEE